MSLPDTPSYLKLLAASGVLSDTELAKAKSMATDASDAKELAIALIRDGLLTSWQAKFLLTGRHRLKIGKYTLLERLERSDFGDRFLAIHKQLNRKIELQLLQSRLNNNKETLAKFLQHAQKAAELDHPNILHVYDIDQESERYYLVVEYSEGRTLADDNRVRSMELHEVGTFLAQIANALEYAHQNQIVHGFISRDNYVLHPPRDIKISNVAMTTLVQELENSEQDPSLVISKSETDDWVAFGKSGIELVDLARQSAGENARRDLVTILNQFIKIGQHELDQVAGLRKRLDDWVPRYSGTAIGESDSNESLDQTAADSNMPTLAAKSSVPESASKSDSQELPVESTPRSKTPIIIGAIAIAILLLAVSSVGAYFAFFNRSEPNKKLTDNELPDSNIKKAVPNRIVSHLPDAKIDVKKFDPDKVGQSSKKEEAKKDVTPKKGDGQTAGGQKGSGQKADGAKQPKAGNEKNDKTGDTKKPDTPASGDSTKKADPGSGKSDPFIKPGSGKTPEPKGKTDKGTAKTGPAKKKNNAPAAFAKMQPAIQLGPIVDEPQAQNIGTVFCAANSLMGLQVLTKPHIAPKNVTFTAKRGSGAENQTWTISVKRKTKSNAIAKFWRAKEQFMFQWLPSAAKDRSAGYLQNCVLRLEVRDKLHFLKLRQPATIGNLQIVKGKSSNKSELKLTHLPPRELKFEILTHPSLGLQTANKVIFAPQSRKQNNVSQPIFIFPTPSAQSRIFWIRIDLKVGRKSYIESKFLVASDIGDRRGRLFSFKGLQNIVDRSQKNYIGWYQRYQAVANYVPKYGEKTKHDEEKSKLSKLLQSANSVNESVKKVASKAEQFHNLAIHARIFFEIDGHIVDVATFDGKPVVYK